MTKNTTRQSPALAGKRGFSLISDDKFRQLYAALLQCTMLDQRLRSSSGYEPWTGCEAASAAVAACLRRGDSITPTPRGLLAGYLHNGALALASSSPRPAQQLAAANREALRHKLLSKGSVTAVFVPTATPSSAIKSFANAAAQSLPVLYVLQGATPSVEVCHGIPVIRVDASDAVALYRVVCESVTRAREGGGPTILECAAWPGDSTADPLRKLEQYLAAKMLFRPHLRRQVEKKFTASLDKIIRAC